MFEFVPRACAVYGPKACAHTHTHIRMFPRTRRHVFAGHAFRAPLCAHSIHCMEHVTLYEIPSHHLHSCPSLHACLQINHVLPGLSQINPELLRFLRIGVLRIAASPWPARARRRCTTTTTTEGRKPRAAAGGRSRFFAESLRLALACH